MPTEEEKESYNRINNTVTPGKAVINPSDVELFDRVNAGGNYPAIMNNEIGVDSGNVPGIMNEAEAMAFAGSMGMFDTYRGVKQFFGFDEEQMKIDQRKLNAIFRNKDYGGKAFATYMGGIIADPAGWVIPIAKAKSVSQMVKQGIAYGTGLGAASYVDEDSGLSRLEQTGLGAVGGGVITGVIGLSARKWAGFDTPALTRKEQLEELPSKNLQIEQTRLKNIRRQEAELSRLKSTEEKLTAIESWKKNVGVPTWNRWVADPLTPLGAVAGGTLAFKALDAYDPDTETAEDFGRNLLVTILGFYAGAKSGKALNRTEFFNSKMYDLFPDGRMNPDLKRLAEELDGRTAVYAKRLSDLSTDVSKLDPESQKILYNLMGGDLGVDEVIALSKGEVVNRLVRKIGDINPATGKKWTKKEIKNLTKEEQLALKQKTMINQNIGDYLGIGLPKDANKLINLNDEQTQLMKEIGEDLRLAGLIEDDVFKTNINSYIKRTYDDIQNTYGPKIANKVVKDLNKIKGDSLFSRGQKYNLGKQETFTIDELKEIIPELRAERKYDYRINETYGKTKDDAGNIINRIDDVADPQYNKALTPQQQASNYGVVIRKSKDNPDKYEIITQLTKQQRKDLTEVEDISLSLAKTAEELRSTVGIGKYYAQLYDVGLSKGFVLNNGLFLNKKLLSEGLKLTNRIDAKGKPIISSSETERIEREMFALRSQDQTLPLPLEYGQSLPNVPYINLGRYNKLKKELKVEQDKAYRKYRDINKNLQSQFRNATPDNPIKLPTKGKDGFEVEEEFIYVPKITEDDPTGIGKAVINAGGLEIPAYGKLNGHLIRKSEYRDMQLIKSLRDNDGSRWLGENYFKLNSFWKKTKTVYNPAVHVNNYVSNYTLFYGSGGNWKELKKVHLDGTIKQILGLERGTVKWKDLDQDLKDMYEAGIFGRDLISAELKGNLDIGVLQKAFTTSNVDKNGNWLKDAIETINKQASKSKVLSGAKSKVLNVDQFLTGWYQLEDRLFRVALYRSRLNQINPVTGSRYTRAEASSDAIKWFVDYNIKSKFINQIRSSAVPFLSYSYRIIPRLAEIGVKNPEKVAVIAALGYAANDLMRGATGGSKREQELERKFMQEYNKKNMFSLGFMPEANIRIKGGEKPKYVNFSRMLPGGDVFAIGGETPGAIPFLPTATQFGGPLIGTVQRVFGIEPFTGKRYDVEEVGMSASEVAANRTKEILKDFVPNLPYVPEAIGGSYSYRKIKRAYEREYGDAPKYNTLDDPLTTMEAVANSLGLKINTADIGRLRRFKSAEANSIQSKFNKKRKKLNNDRMKGVITYEEYLEEVQQLKLDFKETLDELRNRE